MEEPWRAAHLCLELLHLDANGLVTCSQYAKEALLWKFVSTAVA